MRAATVLLALAPTLGCASLYHEADHLAARNLYALAELEPGMPLAEILDHMQVGEVRVREGRTSSSFMMGNPHHSTSVELSNGEPADVLYYYTGLQTDDGIATADELTPVVLSAGSFAGAGWDFLEQEARPEALAEVQRQEMEREIEEARRLEVRQQSWDPLEQDFREELGRASNLIRMIYMSGGMGGLGGY